MRLRLEFGNDVSTGMRGTGTEWEARNILMFQERCKWYVLSLDLFMAWDVAPIMSCRFANVCAVDMLVAGNEKD